MNSINDVVAMILAGGRGTRLKSLTADIAKPAVFFGGKYRIIDFALSNIANSGIDKVGVLTQYETTALSIYIGSGSNWGLNGNKSLVAVLPPKETGKGASWYKGTADAIYQNIDWLDSIEPKYVLILSGDHIYRQDYNEMINYHISKNADLTIACINVDIKEASRFGIIKVDDDGKIINFTEKPQNPDSTLASMGIYIFSYKFLRQALIDDYNNPKSNRDFGKDIIPCMLANKNNVYAYEFKGYWRDVGTVESLWQANMDLLDKKMSNELILGYPKLFSTHTYSKPQYIGKSASVSNSLINQGASILGDVDHSVIFNEVLIENGAKVKNSVIMPGAVVKSGVKVNYAIIGQSTIVDKDVIGQENAIELLTRKKEK